MSTLCCAAWLCNRLFRAGAESVDSNGLSVGRKGTCCSPQHTGPPGVSGASVCVLHIPTAQATPCMRQMASCRHCPSACHLAVHPWMVQVCRGGKGCGRRCKWRPKAACQLAPGTRFDSSSVAPWPSQQQQSSRHQGGWQHLLRWELGTG